MLEQCDPIGFDGGFRRTTDLDSPQLLCTQLRGGIVNADGDDLAIVDLDAGGVGRVSREQVYNLSANGHFARLVDAVGREIADFS